MSKKQFCSLSVIFIIGCLLMLSAVVFKKYRTKIEWNGELYNIENVNPVDAKFARPYNKSIDDAATGLVFLSFLVTSLPVLVVFFNSKDKKAAFKTAFYEAFVYILCLFYSNSIYRILKTFAGRIRPYMYFSNPSASGIADHDFYRSWPSGHSSNVFLSFAFLLGWFMFWHSDSKFKKPLLTFELLICVTTMILRMLSGNHFLTDVLSGAVIGFGFSFATFKNCNSIYKKSL